MADPKCTEPTLPRGPPNCQNHPQASISGCPLDTSQVKPQSLQQDVPAAPQTLLLSPCPHVAQTQPFCSPCGQAAVPGLPDYPFSASWGPPLHPLLWHTDPPPIASPPLLSSMPLSQTQIHGSSLVQRVSFGTNLRKKIQNPQSQGLWAHGSHLCWTWGSLRLSLCFTP